MKKNIDHWNKWGKKYKKNFRATTKHLNIKELEISIINKIISKNYGRKKISILEMGCGNGINLKYIKQKFKSNNLFGIDYSSEMIKNANANNKNINFLLQDVTKPNLLLDNKFDLIFTNRCLINLHSSKKVNNTIINIKNNLKKNGKVLFLENFVESHKKQNKFRNLLKMEERKVASFNKFLNLKKFNKILSSNFNITEVVNYSSLYDLLLYILLPSINNGKTNYNSKILENLKDIIINQYVNEDHLLMLNEDIGQNYYILAKNK